MDIIRPVIFIQRFPSSEHLSMDLPWSTPWLLHSLPSKQPERWPYWRSALCALEASRNTLENCAYSTSKRHWTLSTTFWIAFIVTNETCVSLGTQRNTVCGEDVPLLFKTLQTWKPKDRLSCITWARRAPSLEMRKWAHEERLCGESHYKILECQSTGRPPTRLVEQAKCSATSHPLWDADTPVNRGWNEANKGICVQINLNILPHISWFPITRT